MNQMHVLIQAIMFPEDMH